MFINEQEKMEPAAIGAAGLSPNNKRMSHYHYSEKTDIRE